MLRLGSVFASKPARPTLRHGLQGLVRSMAVRRSSRQCLNLLYSALSRREKARFHALCNALFADGGAPLEDGSWIVKFARKRLVLPLTAEGAWQEWDAAVAILGHDLEIKTTYLLRSRRPKLFFRCRCQLRPTFLVVSCSRHKNYLV